MPIDRISRADDRFPGFCRWMVEQGMEMDDLLYMIDKTHHWQIEWNEYVLLIEPKPAGRELVEVPR